jgi:hypothetical protein
MVNFAIKIGIIIISKKTVEIKNIKKEKKWKDNF